MLFSTLPFLLFCNISRTCSQLSTQVNSDQQPTQENKKEPKRLLLLGHGVRLVRHCRRKLPLDHHFVQVCLSFITGLYYGYLCFFLIS